MKPLYSYTCQHRAAMLEFLMLYNSCWRTVGGYRLAIDSPEGGVVLACDLALEGLTLAGFRGALVNFTAALEAWREIVAKGIGGDAAPQSAMPAWALRMA